MVTIERDSNHVRRNVRIKARWSGNVVEFVTWTRPHENVNCKSSETSNKGFYCYPVACIYEKTLSLSSWAEHAAASSRVSQCCPFAFTFVLLVQAAWLVLPFLLVDVFGIVQPMRNYEGKISSALRPFLTKRVHRPEWRSLSDKNMTPYRLGDMFALLLYGKLSLPSIKPQVFKLSWQLGVLISSGRKDVS